jgi:hypothetical protein
MLTSSAIDLYKIAPAEILDPRGVEGKHSRGLCSWYVPGKRVGEPASMVECRDRVFLKGQAACASAAMAGERRRRRGASFLRQSGLAQAGEEVIDGRLVLIQLQGGSERREFRVELDQIGQRGSGVLDPLKLGKPGNDIG